MNSLCTVSRWRDAAMGSPAEAIARLRALAQSLRDAQATSPDPAWIHLAEAAQIESQLNALEDLVPAKSPLFGVPFAVKDNIDVAGWPTTAACPEFRYIAGNTATVVSQLQAAGAVLIGKTNLDQFATGLVGTRSPFGPVPNTFSDSHISGGSSSGSASVVARGLVAFALGTDTAGSGRVPAGFNNLVGLKPTPGLFSTAGVVPACRTLDCVSVFALTAADAAEVARVLESPEGRSGETRFHERQREVYAFPQSLGVGIPGAPLFFDEGYREQFEEACRHVDALGWKRGAFDLSPCSAVAAELYQGPWTAERYAVAGALIERGLPGVDPVVAGVIAAGRQYSALQSFQSLYRIRELAVTINALWDRYDVLMVPTAPHLPTFEQVKAEPIACNSGLGTYTNFVNLLGFSAVAVPSGMTADGLPFGVTFIARGGCDWALLELAARWQHSRALPLGAGLCGPADTGPVSLSSPPSAMPLAVVGAHLAGLPLHHQIVERGGRLRARTHTAPRYRLYALENTQPPKPGLVRDDGGASIEVEVYDMPPESIASFLAGIPSPLGLGSIELADGSWVSGFICEPYGVRQATEITSYGGWRSYLSGAGKGTSA
jgi:allophanate hydrolase